MRKKKLSEIERKKEAETDCKKGDDEKSENVRINDRERVMS